MQISTETEGTAYEEHKQNETHQTKPTNQIEMRKIEKVEYIHTG